MNRLLALAVLVSFLPTANAQDKGKADFSPSAEYRARYWWMENPGGDENALGSNSYINHRFLFGAKLRASEKFSGAVTMLHNAVWGQPAGENLGEQNTVGVEDNFFSVNEVYGNWVMSEDLSFRFGRQSFQIADGYVMGVNDWESVPYAFEGVLANYEMEFGKFQAFAFKHREMGPTPGVAAAASASKDPEHNAYGLNFDLKTMPEWMKGLNVHVIKNNSDAIIASTGSSVRTNQGKDHLRYGVMAAFGYSMFDLKGWYAANQGKNKEIAAGGAKTERDSEGMMMQAEVGATVSGLMGSRFFVRYHQDSGDKNNADTKDETYESYFYEKHGTSGMMDILGWGNLTFTSVGWTAKPTDRTDVGAMYSMFSKTEKGAGAAGPTAGLNGTALINTTGTEALGTKDDLGNEIDVWAEHRYDGGLSTVARFGYFMPGDVFKEAVSAPGVAAARDDKIMQVMLEAKLTF